VTLREHSDHFALIEQVDEIPPGADHLSASAEEKVDEGKRTREVVDPGAHDTRLFHLLHKIQGDHGPVCGNAAAVVGRQQDRPLQGNSLDAEALDAKPVLVHELEQGIGQYGGFLLQSEGIVPEFRGTDLDLDQTLVFLASQKPHERSRPLARLPVHGKPPHPGDSVSPDPRVLRPEKRGRGS
jgi:hypothetical protein